ncbi:MAG: hypothetical protein BWY54_00743 [Candidatus Dependentiae bacterium ADurb.Bin331]|nr:MAG: hypothetical protein BWY54_00743 [Candidatus Dependentiae bacterium ADurb.Bin331]
MMKFAILIFFAAFTLPLVSMEPNITIVEYEKKALTGDGLAMLNLAQHYSEKNNCIIALQWLMRFGVVVIQETTLIEQEKKDSSVVDFNLEKIKNMVNHNKELNKALKEMQPVLSGALASEAIWVHQSVKFHGKPTWLMVNFKYAATVKFIAQERWNEVRQITLDSLKKGDQPRNVVQ